MDLHLDTLVWPYSNVVGTLLRLRPLAMASAIATGHFSISNAAVPCQVLNASGQWIGGYELLGFSEDGLLTIRSIRTGVVRQLPPERWRDPVEDGLLVAAAAQV